MLSLLCDIITSVLKW